VQVFTASFAKRPKQIGFVLLPVFEITVKGMLTIPDALGLGLALNRDALRENEVSE
jgi:L-alanine-DL-glutamate epimerase-like enolase superfamily enzyme